MSNLNEINIKKVMKNLLTIIFLLALSQYSTGQEYSTYFDKDDPFELNLTKIRTHQTTKLVFPDSFRLEVINPDFSSQDAKLIQKDNAQLVIDPIEIKTGNLGRLIYYSKFDDDEFHDPFSTNDKLIGSIVMDYIHVDSNGNEEIKFTDEKGFYDFEVDEYHYVNPKFPAINKIRLTVIANRPNIGFELLKLKVIELSDLGVKAYQDEKNRYRDILASTDPKEVKSKMIESYKEVIHDFNRKKSRLNTIITANSLGELTEQLENLSNPFTHKEFENFFLDVISKASSVEQSNLENIMSNGSSKSWYNTLGSIANIITGGTFNKIISSIENIITGGITIQNENNDNFDVFRLGSRYAFVDSGSRLKILKPNRENESRIISDFLKIENYYKEYAEFINVLKSNSLNTALLKRENMSNFRKLKKLDKTLKDNFEKVLKKIDNDANIADFMILKEFKLEKALNFLESNLEVTSDNITQQKIGFNEISRERELLHIEYLHTADAIKNYYDSKFDKNNNIIDENKFTNKQIKDIIGRINKSAEQIDSKYNAFNMENGKKVYTHNFKIALGLFTLKYD